jgi:outer membrane protein assembly factor BamA
MLVIAAALLLSMTGAEPQDFLGKTITDVRVEIAGVPVVESGVIELVETRVGEPLAMQDVRGTIEHLVGVGRFEDVRVLASGSDQGVALRWQLIPIQRITKITVTGSSAVQSSEIRREITDRFGARPSSTGSSRSGT